MAENEARLLRCDTCGKLTPTVSRVVVDAGYNRANARPLRLSGMLREEAAGAPERERRRAGAGVDRRQDLRLVHATSAVLRGLFRLAGGFHVSGLENLPEKGPAILAGNHLSWADPPAVRAIVRRRCWFMGNEELFELPVLGWLLPKYGAFPVDRNKVDREAVRTAEAHLRDGDLVCIFPEGGTTITGTLYPFEGGVALLAVRNDAPVVPIAITGTEKVLPMGASRPRYHRGGVTLTVGPPLHPGGGDLLPRRERLLRLTEQLYGAIAALLPPEYVPEEWRRTGRMPLP